MIAQHGAKPGSPIRASFARIGVGSGVLGKVGKNAEPLGGDTVLTQILQAVRKGRNINVALAVERLRLDLIRTSFAIGRSLFNISVPIETWNHNAHRGAWEGHGIDERVAGGIPGPSGTLKPARTSLNAEAAFSRFGTGCR